MKQTTCYLTVFCWLAAMAAVGATGPDPSRIIRISTSRSTLTLVAGSDQRVYELSYGGAKSPATSVASPVRETEFYPQYGDGYILEPALQARHVDGNTSTDLIYVKHDTKVLNTNVTLTRIELKDGYYPFHVTLCFKSYHREDMIEEWAEIQSEEKGDVTLSRFASASPVLNARAYWLSQFCGDYQREATLDEEKLGPGIKILDSKIGVRASRFRIPSFLLSLNHPATEESGEVIGGSLEWSGSFQLAFEVDWENRLRALCGINPFAEEYCLKHGETFVTPATLWTWSNQGKGQVSRNFHDWARRYGIRDGEKPRPILLNNWEATGFDFNEKKIVSLFDGAKTLGVDLFLLDDGWFGNAHPRNDDHAGLGDWQVNTNKLPRGPAYLAGEASRRGLKFGMWIEPEMVNPASDLYEKHPDWVIQQPHRPLELSRNQLDLDLSCPAVQKFVWQVVDGTFGISGLSYVKWDANRYVTQPGSTYLSTAEQSSLLVDYNRALYRIMARMEEKYPNVTTMLCSGGSGRVDYGALKYFALFWPSDNTDPVHRVFIQWGFSHFFPAETIAAHVTRMGNRPLKFTLDVAMSGALGFDLDVSRLTAEERQTIASAVTLYKNEVRDVVEQGDLYRLESPYDHPRAALDYVSADRSRAVLFVYQLEAAASTTVKPRGLDPRLHYRIHEVNLPGNAAGGQVMDGAALMRDGLRPPCANAFDSAVIELVAENLTSVR